MLTESTPFTIEHKIKDEQIIESAFIGQVVIKPGNHMYSYNPSNNKMERVIIVQSILIPGKLPTYKKGRGHLISPSCTDTIVHKVFHDPKKLYCIAINDRNAARKFAIIIHRLHV